jgi:hypothetical protein
MSPERIVHHANALEWLAAQPTLEGCSIITSMPDISEFSKFSIDDYKKWFVETAQLVLSRCPDNGLCLFYQSDIKPEGFWIDKGYLCQKAAELSGHALLAHKIICRAPPGTVGFGRPTYSHLVCFSKGIRFDLSKGSADVLAEAGETTWTRGMGTKACELACKLILTHTETRKVVDPFCGHGTALAVANAMGLDAIGVELSLKRAKKARALKVARDLHPSSLTLTTTIDE